MLNWIKFFTVFLLALTSVIVVTIFISAYKPIASVKTTAIENAIRSKQIVEVEYAQPYNGIQTFVTVFGLDSKGERKAVFIDANRKDASYKEVNLADGISADIAIEMVSKELEIKKMLHVKLGMEEVGPVWEVAFKNENDKLGYVYVLFEDGQWWKRILNL
ncbi:cell wall elongation regulator TseB-like domain-containing protein [Sporosarcina sp. FA9]|uniref:cell wall elongation regulator TseB-like domain-containing protein n=1 Tax=Sporosarcina sp. FA9 TaxID=3413030 RepID=UPI003F65B55A